MKRKILVFVLLAALVSSVALTGCTFVKVNKERKANEVMASISIDSPNGGEPLSLDVTRNEYLNYVNYLIRLYSQYSQYGVRYDVEKLVPDALDALISQKYTVLKGMAYLMGVEKRKDAAYMNTEEYKKNFGDKIVPEGVLTVAERYYAIGKVNKGFKESIDAYVKEHSDEERDMEISQAREQLAAAYRDGYEVKKENGVAIYHKDENGEMKEGLYSKSILGASPEKKASQKEDEKKPEVDYKKIRLRIDLVKTDGEKADDVKTVYLPVGSNAVTTEDDKNAEDAEGKEKGPESNFITAKICKVTYDEPVKTEDEKEKYETHEATDTFELISPRASAVEPEKEDTREEGVKATEGEIRYRYDKLPAVSDGVTDEDEKKFIDDGQIFAHTKTEYADEAEKEAYRQFRESRKNMLVGFDADRSDRLNSLGYFYNADFETAIIEAVRHELKREILSETTEAELEAELEARYENLIEKQREEYEVLSKKEQVVKFAETVREDLTKAYYVPLDALESESFEVDPSDDAFNPLFDVKENGEVASYNKKYVTKASGEDGKKEYSMKYAYKDDDGKVTVNVFYIAHILFKWTKDVNDAMAEYIDDREEESVKEIKTKFVEKLSTNVSKPDFTDENGEKISDAFEVDEETGKLKFVKVPEIIKSLNQDIDARGDRSALDVFNDYMAKYNDDGGKMKKKLGYFVAFGDMPVQFDGEDFPNMARALYLSEIAEEGEGVSDLASSPALADYAFTSYGLHIEKISFAPFYKVALTEAGGLGLDRPLDLDGTTFRKTLKTDIENDKAQEAYEEWTDGLNADEAIKNAFRDKKKIKAFLKDLGIKKKK